MTDFQIQLTGYPLDRLCEIEDQLEALANKGDEKAKAKLGLIQEELASRKNKTNENRSRSV